MREFAALAELADRLQSADLSALADAELCEQARLLRVQIDRLEAEFTRRVGQIHVRGAGSAQGAPSTAAWLRGTCSVAPGAARDRVRIAETSRDLPALAAAAASGEVSLQHASVIAKALESLPEECVDDVAHFLIDAAHQLDPARLATLVRRVRYAIDPDGARSRDEHHRERRWLEVARTFEGLVSLNGVLDAEAGSALLSALDPLMRPCGPADDRTVSQRRADALTELAHHALNSSELPTSGGDRPHVHVTIDWATLHGQTPGFAELSWTGPVGPDVARRLSCDAAVSRIVVPSAPDAGRGESALPRLLTEPPSQPLDVGRTTRTIPPAIRRALVERDGGCTFPGCDRPPPWTDGHHVIHWADGGPTSLDNLVLLCRHHHTYVHETGWTITLTDGRATFTPPGASADPSAEARGSPTGHAA